MRGLATEFKACRIRLNDTPEMVAGPLGLAG